MHTRMSRAVAVIALSFVAVAAGQSSKPLFDPAQPPRAGDEGVFYGPLVRVKDGDSLVAKVQGVAMDFRLADVDAPELDQPYGRQAKQELAALASGRQLVIMPVDTDRYHSIAPKVMPKTSRTKPMARLTEAIEKSRKKYW